jgi:hypothetical protein
MTPTRATDFMQSSTRACGGALALAAVLLSWAGSASAQDYCASDWKLATYTRNSWSDMQGRPGLSDLSTACTIAGRTGHASVDQHYPSGGPVVYTWVCNEDGSECGIDGTQDVQCMGEARTRDDDGTELIDGAYGYIARVPSMGEETADVPMDENANYIEAIFEIRVVCRVRN